MNVLALCNNLLSKNSPASEIEKSLLRGLSDKSIRIKAICSDAGELSEQDKNYKTIVVHENKLILYTYALLERFLPDLVWLPDATYRSWGKRAKNFANKIIKDQRIDIIHSFGFANANHWVAYCLKKQLGIPWIATFFDTWTDYPTRKFRTSYFKRKDEQMEKLVAENADILVHNNYETARIWSCRYGEDIAKKIFIVPINVDFSKEYANDLRKEKRKILKLSHIGTFYPYRTAESLIKSVSFFVNKYPKQRNRIRIDFVGTVLNSDLSLIKQNGLDDVFNIIGRVTPQECQKYYRDSDVFLSVAGNYGENVMFPSKIIKYFFYNRPIIGISPHGTITESELRNAGHKSFLPEDMDGFSDYLNNIINDYTIACSYESEYWKRFSCETIVDKYVNLYNALKRNENNKISYV